MILVACGWPSFFILQYRLQLGRTRNYAIEPMTIVTGLKLNLSQWRCA